MSVPGGRGFDRGLLTALLVGVCALFGELILLVGAFLVLRIGGEYLRRTDFDAATWQAVAQPAHRVPVDATRLRMIDDFLRRHELRGVHRHEVTGLLGEPDEAVTSSGEPLFPAWDLVYYLGPERGLLALDSEWLTIRLNAAGRVSEYQITIP